MGTKITPKVSGSTGASPKGPIILKPVTGTEVAFNYNKFEDWKKALGTDKASTISVKIGRATFKLGALGYGFSLREDALHGYTTYKTTACGNDPEGLTASPYWYKDKSMSES